MRKSLHKVRSVVIKVGTSIISDPVHGLNSARIKQLAEGVAYLSKRHVHSTIVTSGAIGCGMKLLGFKKRPMALSELQACASVGQGELIKRYSDSLKEQGLLGAQILLTREDLIDRKRYLNARDTMQGLLRHGVVPVVNENDTVSVDEIKFGDNDMLSALVANLVGADLLVMLTDTDGFYAPSVSGGGAPERLKKVDEITDKLFSFAKGTSKDTSVGGMVSKLKAAKIATASGIICVIASGAKKGVLADILNGDDTGTIFNPSASGMKARKRWVAFTSNLKGKVVVDDGARDALILKGKSLLSIGVKEAFGNFSKGDRVSILDEKLVEFARGIVNYSSEELKKIKGLKMSDAEKALGSKTSDEVIHRDDLVILAGV